MDVTTNNTKSKVNIRLLVGTGMLSGLAFVLQYLEFPIPIMPFFIRFDFSDLPALIGAFAYGPLAGVIVEFIKNLLHCTVTQSFTVGELSYPAYEKFTPINEIMDAYSKLLPSVGKLWQALLIFNVPFTIVKGLISTLITVLIYKRLSPVLKGRG